MNMLWTPTQAPKVSDVRVIDSYSGIQGLRDQINANAECLVTERYELTIIVVVDVGLPDHDEAKYRARILAAASKAVSFTGKTSSSPAGALKRLLRQTCETIDSDVKLDDKYDTI